MIPSAMTWLYNLSAMEVIFPWLLHHSLVLEIPGSVDWSKDWLAISLDQHLFQILLFTWKVNYKCIIHQSHNFTTFLYSHLTGLYGEKMDPNCGCTIVQKTHGANDSIIQSSNGSRIVIIRNPYDALMALRNLEETRWDHVGHASINSFNGSGIVIGYYFNLSYLLSIGST